MLLYHAGHVKESKRLQNGYSGIDQWSELKYTVRYPFLSNNQMMSSYNWI